MSDAQKEVMVEIDGVREDGNDTAVSLVFKYFEGLAVTLTDSTVDDIKKLFDRTFDYMAAERQLIEFKLHDTKNDLFHDVAQDIIDQLNAEITESKENLERIWQLTSSDGTIQDQSDVQA